MRKIELHLHAVVADDVFDNFVDALQRNIKAVTDHGGVYAMWELENPEMTESERYAYPPDALMRH